ncbi:hypothetical protein PXC01_05790 [Maribacter sp. M208]|uniref:hypothetical protein n=1 Tax=Maribacter huludaoensis TaxID=3030010 RepID=UPI0023EC4CC5|nr:hypothetical protein [Maribacter huludaoensis]MDF4221091.1 hypothetical protein [Maribacter huludaoensis]
MISIDEKLYITREINQIVVDYAEKVVLKDMLFAYSFENTRGKKELTVLIKEVHSFCPDRPTKNTAKKISEFVKSYLQSLSKYKKYAIYFRTLNHKYDKYLDIEMSFEDNDLEDDGKSRTFDEKFGRTLAGMIYDPEVTELEEDCLNLLCDYLFSYTEQLDLSLIDEYTIDSVLQRIEDGVWV